MRAALRTGGPSSPQSWSNKQFVEFTCSFRKTVLMFEALSVRDEVPFKYYCRIVVE